MPNKKNHVERFSFSNLGNGMCSMPFLGVLDIHGVKDRLIRYLWMLKSIKQELEFIRFDWQ